MRPLILLALPLCLLAAPIAEKKEETTNELFKLMKQHDITANLTAIQIIIDEEAAKLSISGDELIKGCYADREEFELTKEEEREMEEEKKGQAELQMKFLGIQFKNTDEFWAALEEVSPKSLAIIKRKMTSLKEKYWPKLPKDAQQFLEGLPNVFAETVVAGTNIDKKKSSEGMKIATDAKDKVLKSYADLPEASKLALERNFCLRTFVRAVQEFDVVKQLMSMMKMMEMMAKMMEESQA